nr:hypothetical protein [Candidatus Levybacteria bacterium]
AVPKVTRLQKTSKGETQSTSMSSQLTLDNGEYLPMDPFGAKSAIQQAFSEIALQETA